MAEEIILAPNGAFNQDDSNLNPSPGNNDVSRFLQGDYRYARNMRLGSSTTANVGAGENIASTLLINNYYIWNGTIWTLGAAPDGTNVCVGKKEDPVHGAFYWAVANSNGNDQVLKFVKAERRIYELLQWDHLNFDVERPVSMALINDFLILTDGDSSSQEGNPPRIMDVTAIAALKFSLGDNFSEFHISFVKWPPVAPPIVDSTDQVATSGTPVARYYQFSYRYNYVGGFRSTWSPFSNFVKSLGIGVTSPMTTRFRLNCFGYMFDYNDPDNTYFDETSAKFQAIVESIELAYRSSQTDPWKLFSRIPPTGNPGRDFVTPDYTGGSLHTISAPIAIISDAEIGQYFDLVPIKSGATESIDNRVMFADNEDDFEIPDFHVSNVEVYSQFAPGGWYGPSTSWTGLSAEARSILDRIITPQRYSFKERGIYQLGIIFQHYSGRTSLVLTTTDWVYNIPVQTSDNTSAEKYHALGFKIPNSVTPPDWAVSYQIVRTNCLNIEFFGYGYANDFVFLNSDTNPIDSKLAAPSELQDIMNTYFDNNVDTQSQLNLSSRIIAYTRKNQIAPDVPSCSRIFIDITNWYLTSKSNAGGTTNNPPNNLFYNFQPGDRVRFMASPGNWDTTDRQIYDEAIIEFTGQGIIINKPLGVIKVASRANNYGSLVEVSYRIEIYRPKVYSTLPGANVLFYEMGEWYPIKKPMTADRDFSKRDWTYTSQADITVAYPLANFSYIFNKLPVYAGDVHMFTKQFYYDFFPGNGSSTNSNISVPAINFDRNNSFGIWEPNNGRAYIAYSSHNIQTEQPNQVRFGGKYFQDSLLNLLNNFPESNKFIYPYEYGRIRAMVNTGNAQVESVGAILLIIGEQQPFSVYVNRVTFDDLSGRGTVGLSDQVLGSYNTLLGNYGTLDPSSITAAKGKVVWWCASKGEWVRYSRDGVTSISDEYWMTFWFHDLAALLIDAYSTDEKPQVISIYDNYHDCFLTFINHSTLPPTYRGYDSYKCAEFNEDYDEWKTIFDYAPDRFARLDNDVYSIIGSVVHIHEASDDYGSFYGIKKDSELEFVANAAPRKNKVWQTVAVEASDNWSFPHIKGDFKSNGATEQESEILLTQMQLLEGTYWADIKRDENSVNIGDPIINGNVMRGKSLRLFLRLDPAVNYLTVFNYLVVGYIDSPRNPKK